MIEQIYNYFTIEMLYYWVNLGVIPFWLMLIFFPQSYLCRFFVTSILPIILLSGAYIFVLYKSYLTSYDFGGNFEGRIFGGAHIFRKCRPHTAPHGKATGGKGPQSDYLVSDFSERS